LSSESENKKPVAVLNDNATGARRKREQEEVLIRNEAVAKHAVDIRAKECDGCQLHKSQDTIDKVERERCRILELDRVAQIAIDTP